MNVFTGNEKSLSSKLVRDACVKLATMLNVAMPTEQLVCEIFSKYSHSTPRTFKKACISISKTFEGRYFPSLPIWRKYMDAAYLETKRDMITKLPDIPEEEKPSPEEWSKFINWLEGKLQAMEEKMDINNTVDVDKISNKYLAEEIRNNSAKVTEKKKMKRLVEIKRLLGSRITDNDLEYKNRLLGQKKSIIKWFGRDEY